MHVIIQGMNYRMTQFKLHGSHNTTPQLPHGLCGAVT